MSLMLCRILLTSLLAMGVLSAEPTKTVRDFGAVKGGWLAFKRVLRCGPWTPMGTDDPPPTRRG